MLYTHSLSSTTINTNQQKLSFFACFFLVRLKPCLNLSNWDFGSNSCWKLFFFVWRLFFFVLLSCTLSSSLISLFTVNRFTVTVFVFFALLMLRPHITFLRYVHISKFFAMYMSGRIRAVCYSVEISTSLMYECLFPILYSTLVGSFYICKLTKSTRNHAYHYRNKNDD